MSYQITSKMGIYMHSHQKMFPVVFVMTKELFYKHIDSSCVYNFSKS